MKIKIIISFRSYPVRKRKCQKKSKKIKKTKKTPLWLHFKPKQFGNGQEREKIKIIVSFRSYQMCYRKFQKNTKKIIPFRSNPTSKRKFQKKAKNLKNTIMASFKARIGWKRPRKKENKSCRSVSFQPHE